MRRRQSLSYRFRREIRLGSERLPEQERLTQEEKEKMYGIPYSQILQLRPRQRLTAREAEISDFFFQEGSLYVKTESGEYEHYADSFRGDASIDEVNDKIYYGPGWQEDLISLKPVVAGAVALIFNLMLQAMYWVPPSQVNDFIVETPSKFSLNPLRILSVLKTVPGLISLIIAGMVGYLGIEWYIGEKLAENAEVEGIELAEENKTYGGSKLLEVEDLYTHMFVTSLDSERLPDIPGFILGLVVEKTSIDPRVPIKENVVSISTTKKIDSAGVKMNSVSNNNVIVFGPPGEGKTVTVIYPTILQTISHNESALIIDPKGEMYADMSALLDAIGYNTYLFSMESPNNSDSWNPLEDLKYALHESEKSKERFLNNESDKLDEELDVTKLVPHLATAIIEAGNEGGKGDAYWTDTPKVLLQSLVYLFIEDNLPQHMKGKYENSLVGISNLLGDISVEDLEPEVFQPLQHKYSDSGQVPSSLKTWQAFRDDGQKEKHAAALLMALSTATTADRGEVLRYSELKLTDFGEVPTIIFVVSSDGDDVFKPFYSIFFTIAISVLRFLADSRKDRSLPYKTTFIMDEFANTTQIPGFALAYNTLRSRNIAFVIVFQNYPQGVKVFGAEEMTNFLASSAVALYLGFNEDDTIETITKKIGSSTAEVLNKSESDDGRVTESIGYGQTELISATDLYRMPPGYLYAAVAKRTPVMLKTFYWEKHPLAPLANYTRKASEGRSALAYRIPERTRKIRERNLENKFRERKREAELLAEMSDEYKDFDNLNIEG